MGVCVLIYERHIFMFIMGITKDTTHTLPDFMSCSLSRLFNDNKWSELVSKVPCMQHDCILLCRLEILFFSTKVHMKECIESVFCSV